VQFATPNDTKAVVWRRGRVHVIRTPHNGGTGEAVSGLGEVGVVDSAAYVWSAGRLLTVSSSWLDFTCGNSHLLAGQRRRAFVWMHDTLTWLPAGASGVNACNDHDQLVGWSTVHGPQIDGRAPVHAMLWSH